MMITTGVRVLAGLAVLLAGRRLFWFFVALIGFIAGFELAGRFLADQSQWVAVLLGVLVGLIGAGLAAFVQRAAVALAGFGAGWFLTATFWSIADLGGPDWLLWLAAIVLGIVGAILVSVLFDYALVALSAFTGATMLLQQTDLSPKFRLPALLVLALIGSAFQLASLNRRERPSHESRGYKVE